MALFRRSKPDGARVPRKDRTGRSPFTVGAIVLVVIAILTYLGFTKHIPFTHKFQLNAVFTNANSLRPNSPVRIAGVNVGKVQSIDKYGRDTSLVTMSLNDEALPIHRDATLKVRPRIFLEGNFFVDIQPGTPDAPTVGDGSTIPMAQTAAPVQFGDVLTALQADDRQNLQDVLRGFGTTLTRQPNAKDDANADPATRGETAARSLNDAAKYAAPALRDASIVNQAFLGETPHDLSRLIRSLGTVTGALNRNEGSLQDFVVNFNTTMHALASESTNLRASIRLLSPTLDITHRTLGDLDRSFPPTRQFALALIPGVRETPSTINASFPWIDQTRALLGQNELRGLARELSPTTRDLSHTIDATVSLLPQQDLLSKCLTRVILPAGDLKIQDGPLTTGAENYKEFWYGMVGVAGEGQNFDGNGMYVRFQPGGGSQTLSLGNSSLSGDPVFANAAQAPLGTSPRYPGKRPPYMPFVPCYTQQLPDVNGPEAHGPPDGGGATPAGSGSTGTGGTGGTGGGITVPGVGTLGKTKSGAATRSTGGTPAAAAAPAQGAQNTQRGGSVAGQLIDRLNPFRATGGGR